MVDVKAMAEWAADLYEQRTRQLAETGKLSICYVHPQYRVTTHEIMKQFGITLAPLMRDFQEEWKKVTKRRGLRSVISGKMKADEWAAKHPRKQ